MVIHVLDKAANLLGESSMGTTKAANLIPSPHTLLPGPPSPSKASGSKAHFLSKSSTSFKTSSQRGTFHGTYAPPSPSSTLARDAKVRDLLLEIERESKQKLLASQHSLAATAESRTRARAQKTKRTRERTLDARNMEESWTGNFAFAKEAKTKAKAGGGGGYSSEGDRYCPLSQARVRNELKRTGALTSKTATTTTTTTTTAGTMNFSTPDIMASATIALSGMGSAQPQLSRQIGEHAARLVEAKTLPLPQPLPQPLPLPLPPIVNNYTLQIQVQNADGATIENKTIEHETGITFQPRHEAATDDSLDLVKLILIRDKILLRLSRIFSGAMGEKAVLDSMGRGGKFAFPGEAFRRECGGLREATVRVVEMIMRWKAKQPRPDPLAKAPPYLFRGENYLLKVARELDFVSGSEEAEGAVGLRRGEIRWNPFVCRVPVRHGRLGDQEGDQEGEGEGEGEGDDEGGGGGGGGG